MEVRMARLEGAYEQIADRLIGVDRRLNALEQRMESRFERLEHKIDSNLKTIITWMLGQTAVILGSVVAVAFALHR